MNRSCSRSRSRSALLPRTTSGAALALALTSLWLLGGAGCSDRPGSRSSALHGGTAPANEPGRCGECGNCADSHAEPAAPTDTVLRVELGSAPVRGPADAPVTIVEFADYECGFCARAAGTLKQLEAEFPGKIRVAWKDFPLPFHTSARPAAIAARAAAAQGRFWELSDKLLAHGSELDRPHLEQYAQELGLDVGRLRGALAGDGALGDGIDADVAEGKRLGVRGTPTFFINGVAVAGAQPLDAMRAQVKAALVRAQAVLDGGARPDEVYARIIQAGRTSPPPTPAADEAPRPRQAVALGDAPVRGPASAPVTLVVFSDFECPFCAKMAQTLKELLAELGGRVRIAHKSMPLPFHPHAEPAARAALAAGQQGRFWEMHDRLFAHGRELSDPELEQHAAAIGLDLVRFRSDLASPALRERIERDRQQGAALGAAGTPTLFVNGRLVAGAQPIAAVRAIIEEELRGRGR
ncbi:MAG: thioredoxin domain-containing protein [Polyangia bacterium]